MIVKNPNNRKEIKEILKDYCFVLKSKLIKGLYHGVKWILLKENCVDFK